MQRFETFFAQSALSQWQSQYLDYKLLKQMLKRIEKAQQQPSSNSPNSLSTVPQESNMHLDVELHDHRRESVASFASVASFVSEEPHDTEGASHATDSSLSAAAASTSSSSSIDTQPATQQSPPSSVSVQFLMQLDKELLKAESFFSSRAGELQRRSDNVATRLAMLKDSVDGALDTSTFVHYTHVCDDLVGEIEALRRYAELNLRALNKLLVAYERCTHRKVAKILLQNINAKMSLASYDDILRRMQNDVEQPLRELVKHHERSMAKSGSRVLVRHLLDAAQASSDQIVAGEAFGDDTIADKLFTAIQDLLDAIQPTAVLYELLAQPILEACDSSTVPFDVHPYLEALRVHPGLFKDDPDAFASFVQLQDAGGDSLLHSAARSNNSSLMRLLLSHGARPDLLNERGDSVLHTVCACASDACLQVLLDHAETRDMLHVDEPNEQGNTPAMLACTNPLATRVALFQLLVDSFPETLDVGQANNSGDTCMHLCVAGQGDHNVADILEMLVAAGADVNCTNSVGNTPLHVACASGALQAVQLLLNMDTVDRLAANDEGRTSLHVAVQNKQPAIVQLLCSNVLASESHDDETQDTQDAQGLLDVQDEFGSTALHLAAETNQQEVARMLVASGADTRILDNAQWTAYDAALFLGYHHMRPELSKGSETRVLDLERLAEISLAPEREQAVRKLERREKRFQQSSSSGSTSGDTQTSSQDDVAREENSVEANEHASPFALRGSMVRSNSTLSMDVDELVDDQEMTNVRTVHFIVRAKTKPGRQVCIVGEDPILGKWNPLKSLVMMRHTMDDDTALDGDSGANTRPDYNVWTATVLFAIPQDKLDAGSHVVRYKYMVRGYGRALVNWETIPGSRKVDLCALDTETTVRDDGVYGFLPREECNVNGDRGSNVEDDVSDEREVDVLDESSEYVSTAGWLLNSYQLHLMLGDQLGALKRMYGEVPPPVQLLNTDEPFEGKVVVSSNVPLSKPYTMSISASDPHRQNLLKMPGDTFEQLTNLVIEVLPNDSPAILGKVHIIPEDMKDKRGTIKRAIISPELDVVGYFTFQYFVITPTPDIGNFDISHVLLDSFRTSKIKLIGHRGYGANRSAKVGKYHRSHVQENTLLSFVTASDLGAEYVEFDVQFTKDKVPVIYHNMYVQELGMGVSVGQLTLEQFKSLGSTSATGKANSHTDKKRWLPRTKDFVKRRASHAEFDLRTTQSQGDLSDSDGEGSGSINSDSELSNSRMGTPPRRNLSKRKQDARRAKGKQAARAAASKAAALEFDGGTVSSSSNNSISGGEDSTASEGEQSSGSQGQRVTVDRDRDFVPADGALEADTETQKHKERGHVVSIHDSFPTLAEVFDKVPQKTGFNIELKYPADETTETAGLHVLERNEFVDLTLKVVFDKVQEKRRNIIFSSFDPDLCIAASLKQPQFPVFFLTTAGSITYYDTRMQSLQQAVAFARRFHLPGIVSLSDIFVDSPILIQAVKQSGLLLFTYGGMNNDRKITKMQLRMGVDAVIADHVGHLSRTLAAEKGD